MDNNSNHNGQDVNGNPSAGAKKGSSNSITALIVLLLGLMGVYNSTTDNGILEYHNKFVKEAYNSVFVASWNPLIEGAKSGSMDDGAMAKHLKANLIPNTQEWIKRAAENLPPSWAEEFHGRFVTALKRSEKQAQILVKSIDDENLDETVENTKQLMKVMEQGTKEYMAFRDKMVKERGFRIEETKK